MRELTKCERSLHSPAPTGRISLKLNKYFCRHFCIINTFRETKSPLNNNNNNFISIALLSYVQGASTLDEPGNSKCNSYGQANR